MCGYAIDWVRTCYASKWKLYRGRPDLEVAGRYVRCPPETPCYPGWHFLGSRIWTDGRDQFDVDLGESRTAEHTWDPGTPPDPYPFPQLIGADDCVGRGEPHLPRPALVLLSEITDGLYVRTGELPTPLRIDFGPQTPTSCVAFAWEEGSAFEWESGSGILEECPTCLSFAWEEGSAFEWEMGSDIEVSCG